MKISRGGAEAQGFYGGIEIFCFSASPGVIMNGDKYFVYGWGFFVVYSLLLHFYSVCKLPFTMRMVVSVVPNSPLNEKEVPTNLPYSARVSGESYLYRADPFAAVF